MSSLIKTWFKNPNIILSSLTDGKGLALWKLFTRDLNTNFQMEF